jgi:hypothetical protein
MGLARQAEQIDEQHHKLLSTICKTVAPKVLLAEIDSIWSTKAVQSSKVRLSELLLCVPHLTCHIQAITSLSDMLLTMLKQTKADSVMEIYKPCFSTLLRLLDVRRQGYLNQEEDIATAENAACTCFIALILRLNESTFRPLFLRLYDWATVQEGSDTSSVQARQIVLFRVMDKMLAKLQTIALPYFSFLLEQAADVLISPGSNVTARALVLSVMRRALSYTETCQSRYTNLSTPILIYVMLQHSGLQRDWPNFCLGSCARHYREQMQLLGMKCCLPTLK